MTTPQEVPSRAMYRSAIFYSTQDQQRIARAYIKQLTEARIFHRSIVTEVTTLKAFYAGEDYHNGARVGRVLSRNVLKLQRSVRTSNRHASLLI